MVLSNLLKNKWVQATAMSAITFAGGAVFGYILGKRHMVQLEKEIDKVLDQLTLFEADGTTKTMTVITTNEKEYLGIIGEVATTEEVYGGTDTDRPIIPTTIRSLTDDDEQEADLFAEAAERPIVNVFSIPDDDWDYEAELATRRQNEPYVIHADEFFSNEMGYSQETMTYYEGDDIMADVEDTPIYGYAGLMGDLKFGHGSKDKNVVYIRSEVIHMEWEVLLHKGMFAQEVRGLEMEKEAEHDLYHSVQKFRRE